MQRRLALLTLVLLFSAASSSRSAGAQTGPSSNKFSGARAMQYTRELLTCGPRYIGSPGHACAENYIRNQFAKDNLEVDYFTASTPIGALGMRNYIVRFPGKKDGIIVLASHYETNYPLRNTSFAGANDGACTSAILMEIANHLRQKTPGARLEGNSVWLVFDDGEEAIQNWSHSDSLYGTRHLAAQWQNDGTLKNIRALLVADMLGDKDLGVTRESGSTPWLLDLVAAAARNLHDQAYFFSTDGAMEDDHLPFAQRGVPVADLIDAQYGPQDSRHPDGYHHTPEDTVDKISVHSLQVSGEVILESIRLLQLR